MWGGSMTYVFFESEEVDMPFEYRFRCDKHNLKGFLVDKVNSEIESFRNKFSSMLGGTHMDLTVKHTNSRFRGIPEYECKIKLISDKGNFYATAKGIGTIKAVSECIDNVEEQIFKTKMKSLSKNRRRGQDPYQPTIITEEN